MTIIAPDMTPPPVDDQIERPEWLDTDRWPFALRRHTITHGDQELIVHVTDEGDGPTLVFVHAGMWSFVWRDAIEALRSRFRCISVDFPGSGLSDGEPADVDLTAFPALLDDVLDARGVERATFVVHDLGGVVGVHAAARRPGRLNGIVAVNTFAWRPDSRSLRVMLRVMGSRVVTGLIGTTRLVPRLTSTRAGVGRHLDRADRRAFFGPYRSRRAARSFHRAMRSARRSPQLFEAAEHLLATTFAERPVFTVFGEKNDPFGFAGRWRGIFPEATSWTVPGGNHFPMCDDPGGFARHLAAWHDEHVHAG